MNSIGWMLSLIGPVMTSASFWLLVTAFFSILQCRTLWSDRRRVIEVWLRNLLGIGYGVQFLVIFVAGLIQVFQGDSQGADTQRWVIPDLMCSPALALAVGGLLCLYRKIFWFGYSVVAGLLFLPLTLGLTRASACGVFEASYLNQLILPVIVLPLMTYYYLRYVRVAR
jgi:hypothetical protein